MNRRPPTIIPLLAAVFGLSGVALGAFGAHGVQDPQAKGWMETAAHYQMIHVFAALATLTFRNWGAPVALRAAPFFLGGIVLFSGALYALAFGAPRGVAMLAPVGGVGFMIGWAILAFAGWRLWRGHETP